MSFNDEYQELRKKRKKNSSTINDIAPVSTTTKSDDRTWFKSGNGNVVQNILGTAGDVAVNVAKGVGYIAEGVGDLASYGGAYVAERLGYEEAANNVRKRAQDSVTDMMFGGLEKTVDKYSVLGDKSDSVAQGLGQVASIIVTGGLAGMAGLGATGATVATTGLMGASSMGSGIGEAYMGGATDEEAATYGIIKGVVDAGSELIFGGLGKTVKALGISKGLNSLDDMFARKLASKITNRVAKNFVEYGVKASAEGVEEFLAGIGSAVAKKLTYMDDKELFALIKDENLLEQFVAGAVTSGVAQFGVVPGMKSGSFLDSVQQDRDFVSGLSTNEQKVVDKEYADRVAEAEKDGKVSKKEKDKIYDAVVSDMEKGRISIDTIEEVLGGDTYKAYRETVASEDALSERLTFLGNKTTPTLAEQSEYAELKAKVDEMKKTSQRSELKSKLGEEVFGRVRNDRLMESYNERGRRSQAFEADLTKYDAKSQATIKKAVESGILNNTRRTHEFVDMIAKISADKGVLFDFTNNEKLKGSVFAVDGKTVNGYVTKDGVTLNIDSAKSLNSVVGHEITHVLEGTELYTALQSAVVEYAKAKGEYDSRLADLTETYKNIKGADVNAELTADMIGDYLFTDTDFINNLATNKNVFQKIYDEIKYLCKVATAGSKEARELEKVKRAFEKAYQESGKQTYADESIVRKKTEVGGKYGVIENLLNMGRVNNTFANEIIRDAELSKAFTDITGVTLEGTTEQKRNQIRNTVREYQNRSAENEELAKTAAKQAQTEQAIRDGGYTSYIRGIFAKGANVADAKEILRNPDMKAEWESITGKTLPTNEKSAIKMIQQTKRNPANIGLPDVDTKYSISDPNQMESNLNALKRERSELEDQLDMAFFNDLSDTEVRKLKNRLTKVQGDIDKIIAEERRASVLTPMQTIVDNLGSYRRSDLESLAEQISDSAWDDYEDLSRSELEDAIREVIRERELSPLEMQSKKFGLYVRPVGKAKYSLSDSDGDVRSYAEIMDEQQKLYQREIDLRERKRVATNNPELLRAMDDHSKLFTNIRELLAKKRAGTATQAELDRIEEAKSLKDEYLKRVSDLQERLGLNAIAEEEREIREAKEALRVAADAAWAREGAEKENKAIEKSGLSAPEYFRKKALKAFKTTANFNEAGYMLPDGKLLNFSGGERNHRYRDHREIGEIYEATQGTAALNRFLSDGNIRIMAESPGIDITAVVEPTQEQYAALRRFIKSHGASEGQFFVDISGADGRSVGKYSYEGRVNADRVLNDIKYFYQNGEVREQSSIGQFLSLSKKGEQLFAPIRSSDIYGKDIRLETAVSETVAPVVNAENAKTTPVVATPDEIAPVSTKKPDKITTAQDRAKAQLDSAYTEMSSLNNLREASKQDFDNEIAELEAEYESKKNKNTKLANNIMRRIERTKAMRESVDADYAKRISDVEAKVERLSSATYTTAMQRKSKQKEYGDLIEKLVGNTKTWVDKKLGIQYQTNTFKRNLRDVVRKADGSRDIAKADAIYNELQGKYNQHEAQLNRRANEIKKKFADLKLTNAEDVYVQMLGELRHNPETTLSEEVVSDYYERHKNKINADKVDKAIEMARELYDGLFAEVNAVLREQGMKEIPYRKGYFPHFTEEKQSLIAKLFNWKTQNNRIPTDIAGLTEEFNPNRKWVSFDKRRTSDVTDYNFSKGLDSYVSGALDWIYHIEDIQKRRAFENYIRYTHSDAGVKERIKAIQNNDEYDANEMQDQIDLVYAEANNPLNNFVTDLRTGTNTLAGKKSSMDRGVEAATNRQFYSVMTNISNRVSANMVGGSISSALTNFIPITQSWGEVSPVSSLKAMRDTLRSMYADDGVIDKSDFLTNRLNANENLYKTTWDKVSDGVTFMMSAVDNFTSQTVWRSKYMENINKGMSEAESVRNADEYAAGLMADRSRGNMPTIFDSKNPLIKTLTAFQLEVANQYNYMFKDMPQNMKDEATSKLVKGYLSMFIGAYAYNALYSSVVGRNAAFDPIRILKELLQDIGDDEEEPIGVVTNLVENVLEEVPFVGGLLGGGRVPIQSALPYNGSLMDMLEGVGKIAEGDWSDLTSEWLKPVYYGVLPMGGGQIKKTAQGLAMFDEDLPIAGSYTNSGNLRFTVEDNIPNRVQAALFGQYASKNARQYFDENRTPLGEKQIQELVDVDIPIADYWEYRDGLKKQEKIEDKFEYIAGLDLPVAKKNILINNVVDRKTPVDLTGYDRFSGYEEFDFYSKNTEKYNFLKENGVSYERYMADETDKKNFDNDYSWYKNNPDKVAVAKLLTGNVLDYRIIVDDLGDLPAKEQKVQYINDLNMDYGKKIILYRTLYSSKEDKQLYNRKILEYLFEQNLPDDQLASILKTLGFVVKDGYVTW